MDAPRDTSPPAFPVHPGLPGNDPRNGMSLRDWYAGQAMAGMVSDGWDKDSWDDFAADAYRMADAMLRRRGEGTS